MKIILTSVLCILCIYMVQCTIIRESKIINGSPAPITPYHVHVGFRQIEDGGGFFGGGTLISANHVLTAAQCIAGFTKWELGFGSNINNELERVISFEAIAHPLFNQNTRDNDIGIIVIPFEIVFSDTISPIALLEPDAFAPYVDEEGFTVGFGHKSSTDTEESPTLQQINKLVIPDYECLTLSVVFPNHFCASDEVGFGNICNGDVGGAFITLYDGIPYAIGINSIFVNACDDNKAAYTRISIYREWIREITDV